METVGKKRAEPPFVLALDVGSSGTRGRLFDARGRTLKRCEVRIRHQATSKPDGTVVGDAEAVLNEAIQIIDGLLKAAGRHAEQIAAVACDTYASSLVGVDARGRPLTPVFTYADARPAPQVAQLQRELDEDAVQQRTGCRFHASYLPARFRWLQATEPQTLASAAYWLSLGEFVYVHLLGKRAASFSTAAWTGLLNRHELDWDAELLAALPVKADQLSSLRDTGEPLQGLRQKFARRWPQLKQAKWFPAIADGYASNIGSDATDLQSYALSLGTSGAVRVLLEGTPDVVPHGLWCYRVNRRQSLLGGALNDGGRAVAWLRGLLKLPPVDGLRPVITAPPAMDTPVVLPFLTGERSPGWAGHATASFTNMDLHTDPAALFRGLLEGIALRLGLIADEVRRLAPDVARVVVSGGAAEDLPEWLGILADVIGAPMVASLEGQTTLRGTAVTALEVVAPKAERVPAAIGDTFSPNAEHRAAYDAARERQISAYDALIAAPPA
ncbi:MAG TPA: gluconokinase [Dehalococcoidia bacterium]|nr:gluconokinase [Dehalococcoidia bacterium]